MMEGASKGRETNKHMQSAKQSETLYLSALHVISDVRFSFYKEHNQSAKAACG